MSTALEAQWLTLFRHDDILGHYDVRYYHGVVSYSERTDTLRHMIRAYLQFFRTEGLETWIAHGTLLGWWWNGKMLPWDWDIDMQVSGATLGYLGTHYNRTTYHYASSADKSTKRHYLLDINPFSRERIRGDGQNIIDARWIDTHNGLYIDITGLSEVAPDVSPGIVSCKNYHRYRAGDLWPLRETEYEGERAWVPNNYVGVLKEEYGDKALVGTDFEGHYWDEGKREWVRRLGEGVLDPLE